MSKFYRNRITCEILSEPQLRATLEYVSLPAILSVADCDALGYDPVLESPAPATSPSQRATRMDTASRDSLGNWLFDWDVTDIPVAEVEGRRVTTISQKWEEIKQLRTKHEYGGVQVEGKWFHTDADSRIKYLALKDKARDALAAGAANTEVLKQLGGSILWKTLDNSFAPMTVALAMTLPEAVANLDAMAFTKAEQHRVGLNAAANPADYDFTAGWPATYLEAQ